MTLDEAMELLATWSDETGFSLWACGCCSGLSVIGPEGKFVVENLEWKDAAYRGLLVRQPDEDQSLPSERRTW